MVLFLRIFISGLVAIAPLASIGQDRAVATECVSITEERKGWTELHFAARYETKPSCVSKLIAAGFDVNARNGSGDTPLHWAAAENPNIEIVRLLLEAGADVNAKDKFGWLPIHTAAERSDDPEVIAVLLEAGSKRNSRAYYVLFSPKFLLKHNDNMSADDKDIALALLKKTDD